MIDRTAGLTGIVLGILGLVGINAPHLIPAALIVFGGSLILSGTIAAQGRGVGTAITTSGAPVQVSYQGSPAIAGLEIMVGFAAAILGILTLILESSWILLLVGFIAVGAALLIVSATFSGAVVRFFSRPRLLDRGCSLAGRRSAHPRRWRGCPAPYSARLAVALAVSIDGDDHRWPPWRRASGTERRPRSVRGFTKARVHLSAQRYKCGPSI